MVLLHSNIETMTSTIANNTPVKTLTVKTTEKTAAKTRGQHIDDLFNALPQVEGFPLTSEQLWDYFNKACKNPDISCRKISTKKDKSADDSGPKRISGYNLFTKEYSGEVPEGTKRITHTSSVWKALTAEERTAFNERATKENEVNGIQAKKPALTYEQRLAEWEPMWKQWHSEPESTRGPEPPMPKKATRKRKVSTPDTSDMSD